MKLKIILFKENFIYLIYNIIMLLLALLFDRFYQMLLFILLFEFIQNSFKQRFHSDSICKDPVKAVKYCKIITICIEITYLIFCKQLNVTIYSNLFIIFLIATFNSILEIAIQNIIIDTDIFNDYDTLINACKQAGITELAKQRLISRCIDKKSYQEIANLESVEVDTIIKSIKRSKRKIRELI